MRQRVQLINYSEMETETVLIILCQDPHPPKYIESKISLLKINNKLSPIWKNKNSIMMLHLTLCTAFCAWHTFVWKYLHLFSV